jgi:hypothetical protein
MKKILLIISFAIVGTNVNAQINCIKCYQQNDSISQNVNNLLLNGGFENTNCIPQNWYVSGFCPNSAFYSCNITGWTCTGGGSATYANIVDGNYSQIVQGTKAVYFGNNYCNPCSGGTPTNSGGNNNVNNDTSCINIQGCETTYIPVGYPINTVAFGDTTGLNVEQTVSNLVIGETYILEFWAGGEGAGFPHNGLFAVDIGFGKTYLRNKPTSTGDIGTVYIIEFIATSTSHTIKFTNWGHICGTCTELVLDNVRLYTLGELSNLITPCFPVSVSELNENLISVYPNPTNENIYIDLGGMKTNITTTLFNSLGQKIITQQFQSTDFVSFNIDAPKGMYFLTLRTVSGETKTIKVLKE